MVDETLPNKSKSNKTFILAVIFLLLFSFVLLEEKILNSILLDLFNLHWNHISGALRIGSFVSSCKVVEIVCSQVTLHQRIQVFNSFFQSLAFNLLPLLEALVRLKHFWWNYIVVNSCFCSMSHIEVLCHFLNTHNANIHWEFTIQIIDHHPIVYLSSFSFLHILWRNLNFHGDPIAKSVHPFIRSSSSRPFYFF